MQGKYVKAWLKFKTKDNQVRLLMSKIHRSIKNGEPHRLSKEEIEQFNEAREAWFDFLRVARR